MQVDHLGRESDDFDRPGTSYCLVHEAEMHQASLRLRHAGDGTLTEQAFPTLWARHSVALLDMVEVTRLCSRPDLNEVVRQRATVELLLGLCRFGVRTGQRRLFGIVYAGVARAIQRAGWQPEVIDRVQDSGRPVLLATWECTSLVDWQLQERLDVLPVADLKPFAADSAAA